MGFGAVRGAPSRASRRASRRYSHYNEGFLSWLLAVAADAAPPLVHSLSYGGLEEVAYDMYDKSTRNYAHRVDHEFVKLATRGVTLMVSAGDDGVGSEFAAELGESLVLQCGTHAGAAEGQGPGQHCTAWHNRQILGRARPGPGQTTPGLA